MRSKNSTSIFEKQIFAIYSVLMKGLKALVMFDSVKNKFLFCLPLLGGCFFIGAASSFFGAFFLVFTLYTLPFERLAHCQLLSYTYFTIFLTLLIIYYVGLIFAGYQTMYGVITRKHTKMFPMLAALIVHPMLVFPYNYVYVFNLNVIFYDNQYASYRNTFLAINGYCVYIFATFFAGYFAYCIINGIRMIESGQKTKSSQNFSIEKILEKLNFKTFFGLLPLETGALVIATTSVILGITFMFSLRFTRSYFYNIYLNIAYYICISIVGIFYAALVIGGILMAQGVERKDPKKIRPLMVALFIQPALTLFFYGAYGITSNYQIDYDMATVYAILTILDVYFGFCIKNLLKAGYEPEVVNHISYERIENLDDVTFDVSMLT
ncbi:unnamed protein product [Chironomus riparius]|uniref:Uncharacterized protein n=1 Tax=Chironomus riparius TaxID=315576 RepID=A0A9N9RYM2_9DIPT|nr:unnamed protein product [Chironomus riparius]